MIQYSYAYARANLGKVMDKVIDDADIVIIERRGHERVAMISAEQLERMQETLYILNSPVHVSLIEATAERAARGIGKRSNPAILRKEFGLEE
jgi:antitoxin YefM